MKILRLSKALWRHWASLGLSDFSIIGNVTLALLEKKKKQKNTFGRLLVLMRLEILVTPRKDLQMLLCRVWSTGLRRHGSRISKQVIGLDLASKWVFALCSPAHLPWQSSFYMPLRGSSGSDHLWCEMNLQGWPFADTNLGRRYDSLDGNLAKYVFIN